MTYDGFFFENLITNEWSGKKYLPFVNDEASSFSELTAWLHVTKLASDTAKNLTGSPF
jgi:predicted lipoprotein